MKRIVLLILVVLVVMAMLVAAAPVPSEQIKVPCGKPKCGPGWRYITEVSKEELKLAEKINMVNKRWRKHILELQEMSTRLESVPKAKQKEYIQRMQDILSHFKLK